MAKIFINGETFDFDRSKKPLSEMLALEKALGIPYGEWETLLAAGSARALAGFCWLVWRRDGRDVAFADIEDGTVEIDLNTFDVEQDPEPGEQEADPTPPGPGSGPSSSGRAAGSSASPASASDPGKSSG